MPFDPVRPPPPFGAGGKGAGAGNCDQRNWQDAYHELEQEKRRTQEEFHVRGEEMAGLAREAESLRQQIQEERERRLGTVTDLQQQLQALERENKRLQLKLVKVQMQDAAKLTDVTNVKKEVVAKTMELEKMVREFQQTHQENLFSRVSSVTATLLAMCEKPDFVQQIRTPRGEESPERPLERTLGANQASMAPMPPAAATLAPLESARPGSSSALLDAEMQQALKRRLEALGDVVVTSSGRQETCCASGKPLSPGTLRVRPRRCNHEFLVEALMPYWAEGICPTCGVSFAHEPPEAGDDSDSVHTSISQVPSLALTRPPPNLVSGAVSDDGGSIRGARSIKESRGRSASQSRARRRHRSPSHGGGARSDISVPERHLRASPSPPRDRHSMSPGRSVAESVHSRASSMPRSQPAWAASQHCGASQIGDRPRPL